MKYKMIAFYAPKGLEVNVFNKSFDFSNVKNEEGVVVVYEKTYTVANDCRFDILAIQRLLKGRQNVIRKGRIVTKEAFVPKEIREFAYYHIFCDGNCEYDSVKEDKLKHGEQTGNFRAEFDDVNFYMVKQK